MNDARTFVVPEEYFHETFGANAADRLVVDIHTDVPAPLIQDEGGVLHNAVSGPNLLIIAVENGPDRMIYAGPVMSYYEFEVTGSPFRLTDQDWDLAIAGIQWPLDPARIQGVNQPFWNISYLVPR